MKGKPLRPRLPTQGKLQYVLLNYVLDASRGTHRDESCTPVEPYEHEFIERLERDLPSAHLKTNRSNPADISSVQLGSPLAAVVRLP